MFASSFIAASRRWRCCACRLSNRTAAQICTRAESASALISRPAAQRGPFGTIGWSTRHPDTGETLAGRDVPDWPAILTAAKVVARATGLGYVGVDIISDASAGPMVLEANARPGLAIQSANGIGLRGVLERIDAEIRGC